MRRCGFKIILNTSLISLTTISADSIALAEQPSWPKTAMPIAESLSISASLSPLPTAITSSAPKERTNSALLERSIITGDSFNNCLNLFMHPGSSAQSICSHNVRVKMPETSFKKRSRHLAAAYHLLSAFHLNLKPF